MTTMAEQETSVDVPESVKDSVDEVFDAMALPEPGPLVERLKPKTVIGEVLDAPTLDDLSDDLLAEADQDLGVTGKER